jgi:hypothetical protein
VNAAAGIAAADALEGLPTVETKDAHGLNQLDGLIALGEPVLLKGAMDHWPALAAARHSPASLDSYLKDRDGGAPVPVMEAPPAALGRFGYASDPREFSFTKRSRPLAESLDRIKRARTNAAAGTIAIQMLPLDVQIPLFVRDNPMPLVPAGARPKLWLGGPVKTQIHNDRDHNLCCVIAGRRRFLLFPPEAVADLYVGPIDNPPPLSFVDPEAPDFEAFPRFREALGAARVAHLELGDALLMPRYWWHHVTSRDPYNAMVNYWWGGEATGHDPYDAFLGGLLALKSLPERERSYWRSMFDLHVFSEEGAQHIPEAARGILGPLTPGLRASLRQRLKAAILKS